jgi:DNA polymerase/3'-5' exonuclease PolX
MEPEHQTEDIRSSDRIREDTIEYLREIAYYYKILGRVSDDRRYTATTNAIATIKKLPYVLYTAAQAKKEKGIGDSIAATIEDFVMNGSKAKLDELKAEAGDTLKFLDLFMGIYGVGIVKAIDFYESGYRTLEDIPQDGLTKAQKLGLKYYKELNTKLKRKEITKIFKRIEELLEDEVDNVTVVGSYRRGKAESGDIDILVSTSTKHPTLAEIVAILDKNAVVKHTLALGKTRFAGITTKPYRRIDIRLVKTDEYPCALMYFTGSKDFNIYMRKRAISMYMKLNEYHLYYDYDNSIADIEEESDIFVALDMDYVAPEDRVEDFDM